MKDATVSVRVENEVKMQAEDILNKLGIPVSVVINSLYRQIIFQRGIPFALSLPTTLKTQDEMHEDELSAKLLYSYEQSVAEEGRPYQSVFDELESEL